MLWLFCFLRPVNSRLRNRAPFLIPACVIGLTIILRLVNPDLLTRFENVSYDLRVRAATNFPAPAATNLGFVFIDDDTIRAVAKGAFDYKYGLYWPRQVYGRLIEELAAQGARTIAFDVTFSELRPDHPLVNMAGGPPVESDDFLALQMYRASNVLVAATADLQLPALFRTNALAVGDIQTDRDSDGVLRRVRAFRIYRNWNWCFVKAQEDPDIQVDLQHARLETNRLILPRPDGSEVPVPLDTDGNFNLTDVVGEEIGRAHV